MNESALWKELIHHAFVEKLEEDFPNSREHIVCSSLHYARLGTIIGTCVGPNRRPTWRRGRLVLVALIAAIVFLSGCAVLAYREELGRLLFVSFENRVEMTYSSDTGDEISGSYYLPTALPSGYIQEEARAGYAEYRSADGNWLRFEQDRKDRVVYTTDTDVTVKNAITLHEMTVQYILVDGLHIYLWDRGADAFSLTSNIALTEEQLCMIIEGLTEMKQEDMT